MIDYNILSKVAKMGFPVSKVMHSIKSTQSQLTKNFDKGKRAFGRKVNFGGTPRSNGPVKLNYKPPKPIST